MAIKEYSLKSQGKISLFTNFKVEEFRCKDGSDTIKICDDLAAALQIIRTHYGKPVEIHSAYRSPSYNSSIGGAKDSQHIYGTAADIRISGVNPRDLAKWIEENLWGKGVNGIGLYDYASTDKPGFVHVDTRAQSKAAQWVQTKSTGSAKTVKSITKDYLGGGTSSGKPVLKVGSTGDAVTKVQEAIITKGTFDAVMESAVRAWQKKNGLTADGVIGEKSWAAIDQ